MVEWSANEKDTLLENVSRLREQVAGILANIEGLQKTVELHVAAINGQFKQHIQEHADLESGRRWMWGVVVTTLAAAGSSLVILLTHL